MILATFPSALIATVPVPLKFTQALAPYIGALPDCAPSRFAAETTPLASVVAKLRFAVPLKAPEVPVTSPVNEIVLPVVQDAADPLTVAPRTLVEAL